MNIITYGEVFHGAFGFREPQAHLESFRGFLSVFSKLGLREPAMEQSADHRLTCRRRGNPSPEPVPCVSRRFAFGFKESLYLADSTLPLPRFFPKYIALSAAPMRAFTSRASSG